MPILMTLVEAGKVYVGKFGLKRLVLEKGIDTITFRVIALGTKPPPKFTLNSVHEIKLETFANWVESEA